MTVSFSSPLRTFSSQSASNGPLPFWDRFFFIFSSIIASRKSFQENKINKKKESNPAVACGGRFIQKWVL